VNSRMSASAAESATPEREAQCTEESALAERWGSRIGLPIVLLIAASFRFWNLAGHGFGNIYYAAAVRSMASSWHNFLYGAFDPAGFLSLDKPPVAFWLQALNARVLGYSGLALHLPQAIEGVLSVLLVYLLTQRVAGIWGGLLAGLVMAITPASVAIDRSNLSDSCLLLVLLLSAWALLRATETGRWKWLLCTAALVGVGFNVKMMAAFVVLPVFYLVYWLAAPVTRTKRIAQLSAATAAVFAVSLSWLVFVDLTPAESRPYAGDSENNSALSFALGRHGFQRVASARHGQPPPEGLDPRGPGGRPPGFHERDVPVRRPPPGGPGPGFGPMPPPGEITGHGGRPGLFRLANREMAGHITWFLPYVAVGLVAVVLLSRPLSLKSPLAHSLILWSVWFATYAVLFSVPPTHIHPYYLTMLAPAIACLVGISTVYLWKACPPYGGKGAWILLPIVALLLTAIWQCWVLGYYPKWQRHLVPVVLVGLTLSLVAFLVALRFRERTRLFGYIKIIAFGLGLISLSLSPALWSATPALAPGGRMVPLADPALLEHQASREPSDSDLAGVESLANFLVAQHRSERFLMAVADLHLAAPIIIATGKPVMAYGGYTGEVPTVTKEQFVNMVETGVVRFVMLNDRGPLGAFGRRGPSRHADIAEWIKRHGHEVESSLWRPAPALPHDLVARFQLLFLPGQPLPAWGPTDAMMHRMYRDPAVRLYDCRPVSVSGQE